MNRYLCKCGRAANKSTNADNTGNRETEGCEGCPYLMPWGPTEWDHTRHAMVMDVKGYECRMSPTLEYRTELRGHLDDKTTIRITSLDFDFLERVSDWVKEHYPNGELSGGFSRDRIRPAEYVDEGRYRYTLACSQNKKGIAAKRALWAEFFDETFHRKDMDADAEKQKILRDIEQGKAAAHKDAATTDKGTNTMLIYRDPATGWLYRVSPQPEHGSYVMQYRDPANSATWKWCANWNIGNIYRESLEEVLEARAKRDGWELVSGSAGIEPPEVDANTLPAPGYPADAGSATQSLSAAGPASLEAEPEATPFDYSGLDTQTVDQLVDITGEFQRHRNNSMREYIQACIAVSNAHELLAAHYGGKWGEWCKSQGLSEGSARNMLNIGRAVLGSATVAELSESGEIGKRLLQLISDPKAPTALVEKVEKREITTAAQFQREREELEAQLKAEREAREKAEHEAELDRKEREDAHAAALRYKAEADRRAQDQNRLEGLVQTVTHERDGARQALAAAKLRGDKLKEENDALREQPIRGDFADADEIDRRAQEKAEAMTAEYRDQIAELQDRAKTGDANACYDQVILASRALENAWTLAKSAYKRLPAGMRAYPREMLHNAFAKFEEELKCL